MWKLRNLFTVIILMILATSGCEALNGLSGLLKPPEKKAEVAEGDMQQERDPVAGVLKDNHGIHFNKNEWVNQNLYRPDSTARMISSSSAKGVSRQSYAETGGDLQVDVDRQGKKMVYASTRYAKTPQICMQGTSSKAVTVMTEDNMSDMMPKFSPDGKLLAWCSDRYGNWDILVQSARGTPDSAPKQITRSTDDEIHPAWSQDAGLDPQTGQIKGMIAYSRFNSMDGLWQIWIRDARTGTTSFLTEGLFPQFKPVEEIVQRRVNGTMQKVKVYTIVYQRHRKRDVPWYSIWTITVQMTPNGAVEAVNPPREIVANDKWAAITPCWSPKGDYIAFASVRKSMLTQWQARIYKPDDIWVVRVDGTDLTQITRHGAPDWNPCWAPEKGNPYGRIYFSSERAGVANIWSVKPIIAGMIATGGETGMRMMDE